MKKIPALLLCLLCFSFFTAVAFADFYKYTDGKGAVVMTNKLESVPAKFRSSMTVIKEEPKKTLEGAPQSAQPSEAEMQSAAPAPAPVPEGKFAELSARYAWFKPLVYLAVCFVLFYCLTFVTRRLPSRLLGKVIYVAFSLAAFTFLYKTYMSGMVERSQRLMEDASKVVKKANARPQPLPADETAPAQAK